MKFHRNLHFSVKFVIHTATLCPPPPSLSLRAATDTSQTYESILRGCHGYHNPSVVDYLLEKVGISDTHPPSVMRGLQRSVSANFSVVFQSFYL